MKRKLSILMVSILFLMSLFPSTNVLADVAPPEMPPGANLDPGDEATQVRMMAETVILNIRQDPNEDTGAIANTAATFTMRNLGTEIETMQARFPLSFVSGASDGFGNYPEINQISVKVNGMPASTQRLMQPASTSSGSVERGDVPWAVFNVTFPPNQDVTIEVAYVTNGFGYYPYEAFKYILETGAGWKDAIGSADIIVSLPYAATSQNIWVAADATGFSETTPGGVFNGNELRWHFENLEPTSDNNIEVTVVSPSLWQKILNETDNLSKHPNDGESWGRLGKDYKEIAIEAKHGNPRTDADGREMYTLSQQAYEKCLALLPNDPLWHFGYADLLWSHYYFDIYMTHEPDTEALFPRILNELKTSLDLDPNNQRAKDLLFWISSSIPGSVSINDSSYDFLGLTATPPPPTPYLFITETPIASPTVPVIPTATIVPTVPSTLPTTAPTRPPSGSPICGGAAMVLPLLAGAVWWKRKIS